MIGPEADIIRKVAWIQSDPAADRGGGDQNMEQWGVRSTNSKLVLQKVKR